MTDSIKKNTQTLEPNINSYLNELEVLANRLRDVNVEQNREHPEHLTHTFFTNSDSENIKNPEKHELAKKFNFVLTNIDKLYKVGSVATGFGGPITSLNLTRSTRSFSYGFGILSFGLLILNFIKIPSAYLISFITGERVKISVSRVMEFVVASALLTLAAIALAVPAAAPIIALVGGSITLVVSIFALGKGIFDYLKLRISTQRSYDKFQKLSQNIFDHITKLAPEDQEQLVTHLSEIKTKLEKRRESSKKLPWSIFDKALGVILSATMLIGLAMSLTVVLLPIGFPVVFVTTIIGASYGLARLMYSAISSSIHYIKSKTSSSSQKEYPQNLPKNNVSSALLKLKQGNTYSSQLEIQTEKKTFVETKTLIESSIQNTEPSVESVHLNL